MSHSNPSLLVLLQQQLDAARTHDSAMRTDHAAGQIIHVPGTGRKVATAYEQLRNAAEYTEDHLLLQRAIMRFYKRNFSLFTKRDVHKIGEELIVELTQAGYLLNGSFSHETALKLQHLADIYGKMYGALREAKVTRDDAADWALSLLSVETEGILNPHSHFSALAYASYQHYLTFFPKDAVINSPAEEEEYEISLYIAVHQALLKSDIAIVRHDLMRMYHQTPNNLAAFIAFNHNVTKLYTSPYTQRLKRIVSKHAAPLRILKSMAEDREDLPELLADREQFLDAYDRQVATEYKQVHRKLNRGILKSIIFLFITKVLIGLGLEIPYDLIFVGSVAILPLAINLLFPPLYMASLKLGLKVPSQANAHVLHEYIEKALFTDEPPFSPSLRDPTRKVSIGKKLLYAILFFIPFAITVYILLLLHFNWMQAVIFFMFLSTASFLGFRLSSMIRELELVSHQINLLSTIRDFFYLPFILVGQWLSSKYARINAVAHILDIAIELPLKTVLRLIRQWTRFIKEKHDEIY
ncbi:MAG: hypothetical protein ABWX94_03200 [Candidatus Saccharimonadales bacterium]